MKNPVLVSMVGLGIATCAAVVVPVVASSSQKANPKKTGPVIIAPKSAAKSGVQRVVRQECSPGGPETLLALAVYPDVIAVGTVRAVIATEPVPSDGGGPDFKKGAGGLWMGNRTVYQFEVEEYLKGDPRSPSLKVWEYGGGVDGVEYVVENASPLVVGDRYILSLRNASADRLSQRYGFVPAILGSGKSRQVFRVSALDEYRVTEGMWGRISLAGGVAEAAAPEGTRSSEMFQASQLHQVLSGKPADAAVAAIRNVVKQIAEGDKRALAAPAPPEARAPYAK